MFVLLLRSSGLDLTLVFFSLLVAFGNMDDSQGTPQPKTPPEAMPVPSLYEEEEPEIGVQPQKTKL